MSFNFKIDIFYWMALIVLLLFSVTIVFNGVSFVWGGDAVKIFVPTSFDSNRLFFEYGVNGLLYNPYVISGYSQWEAANYHAAYPFFFNWIFQDSSVYAALERIEISVRFHLIIFGAGIYFLCRSLEASRLASITVALVAPFMPAVLAVVSWVHITAGLSWMPWAIGLSLRLMKNPSIWGAVSLAFVATFIIYANPAQSLVITLFSCVILCLFLLVCRARAEGFRWIGGMLIPTIVCFLLIIAFSGYYIISLRDFHGGAIRWLGDGYAPVIGHEKIPFELFVEHSYSLSDLLGVVIRSTDYNREVGNLFIGIPFVFLAFLSIFYERRAEVWAMLLVSFISILFSLELFLPIYYEIPLVNKVRQISWWTEMALVAVVPLSAIGLDKLLALDKERRMLLILIMLFISSLMIFVYSGKVSLVVFFVCSALVFASHLWKNLGKAFLVSSVLIISCSTVFLYPKFSERVQGYSYMDSCCKDLLGISYRATKSFDVEERVKYRFAVDFSIEDSNFIVHGLANQGFRMIRGTVHPQDYNKFSMLYFPNETISKIYGVKYTLKQGDDGFFWQELPGAMSRAYFVNGKATRRQDPVGFLTSGASIPLGVIVSSETGEEEVSSGKVSEVVFYEIDALGAKGKFKAESSGFFVWSESDKAGWDISINGKPMKVIPVNGYQVAVFVDAPGEYEFVVRM